MRESFFIACDLGAGSGRVILGRLCDGRITLDEIHRFTSPPVRLGETLRWDIGQIFGEIKTGLSKVAASGKMAASVSVDSWGVDYVLLDEHSAMSGLPYHYRDGRTDAVYAEAMKEVGPELIFNETGIQFMSINTLYQLAAETAHDPVRLRRSKSF